MDGSERAGAKSLMVKSSSLGCEDAHAQHIDLSEAATITPLTTNCI